MRDLRRFPVSDEFIPGRQTFCVILDRNEIFKIPNYWFSEIGHVTPEDMEMSEITLRIECKHFRFPGGPASGRNCPLKSRNPVLAILASFFRVWGYLKNGKIEKMCWQCRANFFRADGTGLRSIGGLAVALSPETVLFPDEKHAWAAFSHQDIPFSTLRFLDCRDAGFAPGNEERWSWVTVRL